MASGTPWNGGVNRGRGRRLAGEGVLSLLSKRLWSERAGDASAPRWRPAPRVPQHRARGPGGPFQQWHCWGVWGGGAQVHRPAHASSTLQDGDQRKPRVPTAPQAKCPPPTVGIRLSPGPAWVCPPRGDVELGSKPVLGCCHYGEEEEGPLVTP